MKTNPKPTELSETFRPDLSNEFFAERNRLNLKEELAAFSDLHRSLGSKRKNWQSVFRQYLKDAAWHRGRIRVPDWVPGKEWTAYLNMRERIRKGATQAAQRIAVRMLTEMREKGQNVAAILSQSTRNEWPGIFEIGGGGPRGKRVPWVTTGSLTENVRQMTERYP